MSWKRIILFYVVFGALLAVCVSLVLRAADALAELAGSAMRIIR